MPYTRNPIARFAAGTALAILCGCGGKQVAGGCGDGFAVRFAIGSVKEGLPLDSLALDIAVDGGEPQKFNVNLKTGVSTAAITAAQGQAYALRFELFSSSRKIGKGESQGKLTCDLDVALNPVWDDDAARQVKADLGSGKLLPPKLSLYYTQALPGTIFTLPLDTLSGARYRWYVKLNDSNLIEDEGQTVRFPIAESLAGKSLTLRLQVVTGNTIKEEIIWVIAVLAAPSQDRIARMIVRADTASKDGISFTYKYAAGRLAAVESYEATVPLGGVAPAGVESLYYDGKGRLERTRTARTDGGITDSSLTYDSLGRIVSLKVEDSLGSVVDSLSYEGGKLYSSRRFVAGKPVETVKYRWTGADTRIDSLFHEGTGGLSLARVATLRFRVDSLIERRVAVARGALLEPYTRETIAYNGLGSRAWRELWLEGQSASLEQTDGYAYDPKGRLLSIRSRDIQTGLLLQALDFEYAAPAAKAVAKTAAGGAEAILADLRFMHSEWERGPKPPRSAAYLGDSR